MDKQKAHELAVAYAQVKLSTEILTDSKDAESASSYATPNAFYSFYLEAIEDFLSIED